MRFDAYLSARIELVEQMQAQRLEQEYRERLKAEIQRLKELDEEARAVLHARTEIEDIMTWKCPRCGQAFVDFEGCLALFCSRCDCKSAA